VTIPCTVNASSGCLRLQIEILDEKDFISLFVVDQLIDEALRRACADVSLGHPRG